MRSPYANWNRSSRHFSERTNVSVSLQPRARFGRSWHAMKPKTEGSDAGKAVRHILSLSGGKDSAALAVYMRDRVPDMEYIFHDSQMELPETYAFLERLEAFLGKPIVKTTAE